MDHVNPSAELIIIDSKYTGITLGMDTEWDFNYKINLEFASLKSALPLQHLIQRQEGTEKNYKGYFNNENSSNSVLIESEFGTVKLKNETF